MTRLVVAAAERLNLSADEVTRWLGRCALSRFALRFPDYFDSCADSRSLLLHLNTIIPPEVHKLSADAMVPIFRFRDQDDTLTVEYISPRKLCRFAMGLMEGAADYFRENLEMTEDQCMREGATSCRIHLRFTQAAPATA